MSDDSGTSTLVASGDGDDGDDVGSGAEPAQAAEPVEAEVADVPDEAEAETTRAEPTTAGPTLGDTLRTLVVAASAAAAVIHFAYAPSHFDEKTSHGVFFLVVAWLQVAVAAALVAWRRRPEPWLAAVAVNGGVLAVWLGSRTVGFPESHHDGVGFADSLASALELVAVLGALAALSAAVARRPSPRVNPLAAGVAGLALVGLVSASVTPSVSGEGGSAHAHGDGADMAGMAGMEGMDHAHGAGAAGAQGASGTAGANRCDLGFNTVNFNAVSQPGEPHVHDDAQPVDFTLEQWADVFVDQRDGIPPSAVVGYLQDHPVQRDGILSGGLTHTLSPDPWIPLTDPDECAQLADELERAQAVAASFPTIADAEAAGYHKVTSYLPGIAAHYINTDYIDGDFELEKPEMLLYDGDGPTAHIVGLSYYIVQEGDEEPTDGFTGPNDHYHRHVGLCFRDGVVVAGSNATEEECAAEGGNKGNGAGGWMSHVWIVPGCESDWGVFSGANPELKVRGLDTTGEVPMGCGTGASIEDAPAFDPGGEGPHLAALATAG
ncbi:MAG TPA: hypothetical protein VF743_06355 [Acidimicrobiales bacterium]